MALNTVLKFCLIYLVTLQTFAQKSDFAHIDFSKADSLAAVYKDEGLQNLPDLTYKLTHPLITDAEKFRAIFLWVSSNIANDYDLYLKHKRKRFRFKDDSLKLQKWKEEVKKIIIRKLVKNKKTICTGYAYLINELSNFAGLQCKIVQGYGRTSTTDIDKLIYPNHSWNAVKLNKKWYLSDATWASGIPNPSTNRFIFRYNDGFFLAEPQLFAVNHHPLATWTLLQQDTVFLDEFLENPIIYGQAYEYLKSVVSPKKMYISIQKEDSIVFKYKLLKTVKLENVTLLVDNGVETKTLRPLATLTDRLLLTIEQSFKTKGLYDIHLMFGPDLISTYTVNVKSDNQD